MMLFFSLSLPFTLLNLEWILNTTTRLFANVKETAKYDFIVIGGGNAYVYFSLLIYLLIDGYYNQRGLAVASRLAEDASITVAVLEAGSNVEHLPEVCRAGLFLPRIYYTQGIRCLFQVFLGPESPIRL